MTENDCKPRLGFNIFYEDGDQEDLYEPQFIEFLKKSYFDESVHLKSLSHRCHILCNKIEKWKTKRLLESGRRSKDLAELDLILANPIENKKMSEPEGSECRNLRKKIEECLEVEKKNLASISFQIPEYSPPRSKSSKKDSRSSGVITSPLDSSQQSVAALPAVAQDVDVVSKEVDSGVNRAGSSNAVESRIEPNVVPIPGADLNQEGEPKQRRRKEQGQTRQHEPLGSDVYEIAELLKYDIRDGKEVIQVRWKVSHFH